jgi:RimJ/RimL family protein N-acetyltransferase
MKITVRRATIKDQDQLLGWRNDKEVRNQSFTTKIISRNSHAKWLSKVLLSKNHVLLIAHGPKKEPIGQVRFDIKHTVATVNISIEKAFRGKGISKDVLKTALKYLFKINRTSPLEKVVALVKVGNTSSMMMFERAGFKKVRTGKHNGIDTVFYCLVPGKLKKPRK